MCPFVFTYSLTHPSLNAQQVICVFIHTYICVCLYLHCLLVYSSATFVPRAVPQTDITIFFMIYSLDCSTGLVIDLFLAYNVCSIYERSTLANIFVQPHIQLYVCTSAMQPSMHAMVVYCILAKAYMELFSVCLKLYVFIL